jgi:hypothetical protein
MWFVVEFGGDGRIVMNLGGYGGFLKVVRVVEVVVEGCYGGGVG